jgi:glycosyltransferase involved in cell wall biosynthesis
MLASPLVSVIIPVYNGEKYIGAALESVLAQDYPSFEIIVVDDGSTDGSAEAVKSCGEARYLYQRNQGVAVARNTGITASRAEYVAFLDQDDLWAPEKLRIQMDYLEENPSVGYVLARQSIFIQPGMERPSWLREEHLLDSQAGYLPGTLVARKALFGTIGCFDPKFETASDAEWFFRTKDLGVSMTLLPDVLLHHRIHSNNQSFQVDNQHRELLRIARLSMLRQMKKPGKNS